MIKENESKPLSHNEVLKEADPILAGELASTLLNPEADRFSNDDGQFLKFHGIYQQDLRTLREERDAAGQERAYSFMIRVGIPGGVGTAELE